jgi:hypothetical protein
MTARQYLTHADLARLLFPQSDSPVEMLYKKLPALIRDQGFPEPERALGNVWDPRAIERWQDARLPGHLRAAPPEAVSGDAGGGVVGLDEVRRKIHGRLDRSAR